MLLATEAFLVPFFKRISFYIVKFHFFNSMHPRSIFFSAFVHNKVAIFQAPSQMQVWIAAQLLCVSKKKKDLFSQSHFMYLYISLDHQFEEIIKNIQCAMHHL